MHNGFEQDQISRNFWHGLNVSKDNLDRSKYDQILRSFGLNQMSYGCFGKVQIVLKHQGPSGIVQMSYGPNVLWILYRTKYQGHFGQDQMSANHPSHLNVRMNWYIVQKIITSLPPAPWVCIPGPGL